MAPEQSRIGQDQRQFERKLLLSQTLIGLDQKKIALVQVSWEEMNEDTVACASLFCSNLCRTDPIFVRLFERSRVDRSLEVMRVIGFIIGELDHVEKLVPYLKSLADLLRLHGVPESSQHTAGEALFQTLQQSLGQRFTPAAQTAWALAYGFITRIMIAVSMPAPGRQ